MAEQKESRLNDFLENPERSLWSIAIPVIAGMAIQTFYSIVDMLFIGQLGGDSIAAVAFNMPLYFFVMGITFGIGTGITATIARAIGENDKEKADNAAKHGLLIALFMGITLTLFGLLIGKKVLSSLGSPSELIDESWSYLRVTCYGMLFIVFSIVFRSILAGEGDMKFPVMVA
ncbi:MAG: MATE family efflux transporter, partial [Candidatus Poseidoniia archaeon]|nr:MATE family efflux transporter [Candidatus Poseidoniia archaeon]